MPDYERKAKTGSEVATGGSLGRSGARPRVGSRIKTLEGQIMDRAQQGGARAGGIEQDVDAFRRSFDARDYARETAGAAFADYREDFDRGIRDLRGQQVSMGRLKTGFATEDEDQLGQDLNSRLSRELARGAFTSASLDLENQGAFAAEGAEARNDADDALTGMRDVEQARANEKKRKRSGILGFLGGAAGAVGGFALGGPAGAVAGAKLGGSLGSSI